MKFLGYFLAFIILVLLFSFFHVYDDKDTCLDVGVCREGLTLNTENGQIIISEQTCKQENGTWNNKKKVCIFKQKD